MIRISDFFFMFPMDSIDNYLFLDCRMFSLLGTNSRVHSIDAGTTAGGDFLLIFGTWNYSV